MAKKDISQPYARSQTNCDPQQRDIAERRHKKNELLGIRNVGLVDFHKQGGMVHEVILVSVKELNDKFLKDGNLVFNNGDNE